MSELEDFRKGKDNFFQRHPQSPLSPEQQQTFQGLQYFPENSDLRVRAILDSNVEHDTIEMETSTGDRQLYRREGKITFTVDGAEAVLYLYSANDPHELFLPFRDATSGKESYGAGRYLEMALKDDGTVLVDFNYAYNPYCAYNDFWSCPVPPVENWLTVPVRAGEKAWH